MMCCVTWLTLLLLICCDVETNPGPQNVDKTKLSRLQTEFLENDTQLLYGNSKFEETSLQKFISSDSKIDFNNVPEFPDHEILAEISSLVYEDWNKKKTLESLPKGWELLTTAKNVNILNGYFGIALWHEENGHIVIAHRGTDIANSGSVFTDLWSVVLEQNGEQMNSACTFALKIKNQILQSKNRKIQLIITGHSLGGWLAQITTLVAKYFRLKDNGKIALDKDDFNIQLIHPHTVVFESPGCKEMLLVIRKVYDVRYNGRKIDLKHLDITNYLTRPNAVNTYGRHIGTILTLCGNDLDTTYIRTIEDHGIVGIISKLKAKNNFILKVKLPQRKNTILDYILFIPKLILQALTIIISWIFNIDYIPENNSETVHPDKCDNSELYVVNQWPRLNYTDHLVSIYTDILKINDSTLENLNIEVHVFNDSKVDLNAFTKNEIYFLHVLNMTLSLNQNKSLLQYLPTIFLQFKINDNSVYCDNPRRFRSFVRQFVRVEENMLQFLNRIMDDFDIDGVISFVKNFWKVPLPSVLKLNKNSTIAKITQNTFNGVAEKPLLIISNYDVQLWSQILCSTFPVVSIDHNTFLNFLPLFKIDKITREIKGKIVINCENIKNLEECLDIINEIQFSLPHLSKYFVFVMSGGNTEQKIASSTVNILENKNVLFGDLDDDSKHYILNCVVNFQGEICKLNDLVNDDVIDDLEVHEIVEKYDNLNIGSHLMETTEQFYIERNLIKQKKLLYKNLNDQTSNDTTERKGRQNNNSIVSEKRVLISANPGEGKTTYLRHLAVIIREFDPFHWVVYLNLIDKQSIMLHINYDMKYSESYILFLYESLGLNTTFDKYIFNHYIKISKKIVFLIDGYDEIDPYFRDNMNNLVSSILNENIKQLFVTSSSSMVQYLQEKLQIHSLNEISKQEQLKYFGYHLKSREKANFALAALHHLQQDRLFEFCGVPLQMRMLANIFSDNHNIEDGKLRIVQIFDIYSMFADSIFAKYTDVKKFNLTIIRYAHQLLAIKYLFPRLNINDIDPLGILSKIDYKIINAINIARISDDKSNIQFIHKTIATFLLSEFITNKLISIKSIKIHELEIVGNVITNLEFINKIILIFIDPHYKAIRSFVDNFLQSMQDIIDNKISENIKLVINTILDTANNSYNLILHITGLENLLYVLKFTTTFFTNAKLTNLLNSTANYDLEGNFLQSMNTSSPWQWINPSIPVRRKVNTQISTKIECTPLALAAMLGHVEIMKYLLQLNADINGKNDDEKTALHLAIINGQKDSVKLLLENNANASITDLQLNTPLHYATSIENVDIVTLLLEHNADKSIENDHGEKAVDIAIKKGNELIIQTLKRDAHNNVI